MELGQKLRQARLEAGLSQRQLCENVITRNMLSQIENGSARPSMETLTSLAGRLGRPIGYFLGEAAASANGEAISQAREAYGKRNFAALEDALEHYCGPDALLDGEYYLLKQLLLLEKARNAIESSRSAHARQLLEEAEALPDCYRIPELEQRRMLLLARASREPVALPADDFPNLVRAEQAWKTGKLQRCLTFLEACENQEDELWQFLRGEVAFWQGDYEKATMYYSQIESLRPRECYPRLEQCYRAMENYKKAYEYACKQR